MSRPQFIRKKPSKPEIPALFKQSQAPTQTNNKRYVEDDIVVESDEDREVSDLEESVKKQQFDKSIALSRGEDHMNMLESVDSLKYKQKMNNFLESSSG